MLVVPAEVISLDAVKCEALAAVSLGYYLEFVYSGGVLPAFDTVSLLGAGPDPAASLAESGRRSLGSCGWAAVFFGSQPWWQSALVDRTACGRALHPPPPSSTRIPGRRCPTRCRRCA